MTSRGLIPHRDLVAGLNALLGAARQNRHSRATANTTANDQFPGATAVEAGPPGANRNGQSGAAHLYAARETEESSAASVGPEPLGVPKHFLSRSPPGLPASASTWALAVGSGSTIRRGLPKVSS